MLYAVIIAGGVGERFWPRSRNVTPKQLLSLTHSGACLLEETVERLLPMFQKKNIFIVTSQDLVTPIGDILPDIPKKNIIGEPFRRNTAACIGLAATLIQKADPDPDATMVVLPADHKISNKEAFHVDMNNALSAARQGYLATIGVMPTRPETEYGYIQLGEKNSGGSFYAVDQFKEKPDKTTAKRFFEAGNFLWNSGIFVWEVAEILDAISETLPALYSGLMDIEQVIGMPQERETIATVYEPLESISIDHGVMEKMQHVAVVKSTCDWDDLGLWTAMDRLFRKNKQGNIAMEGEAVFIDSTNTTLYTDTGLVGVIGLENTIVVRSGNAVLVCAKEKAKDVKALVETLKTNPDWQGYL